MTRLVLAVALAAVLAAPPAIAAGPTVTVAPPPPEWKWVEFSTTVGKALTLAADKAALWLTVHEGVLFPDRDGKAATFSSSTAGDFRLFVVTADGATPVLVRVTGTTPPPSPPPSDPLRQRLKAAYDADPAAAEAKDQARRTLAELYKQAAGLVGEDRIRTAGELREGMRKAAEALAPNALVGLRKLVAEEIARVLPVDGNEELTPTHRKAAADLFARLAAALNAF